VIGEKGTFPRTRKRVLQKPCQGGAAKPRGEEGEGIKGSCAEQGREGGVLANIEGDCG